MEHKENIIEDVYKFIVFLSPILEKFPRSQKFLMADRIQVKTLDILDVVIEAYYEKKDIKYILLREVNFKLEQLRYLVRISYELKLITPKQYGNISKEIQSIGSKAGGWLKSLNEDA